MTEFILILNRTVLIKFGDREVVLGSQKEFRLPFVPFAGLVIRPSLLDLEGVSLEVKNVVENELFDVGSIVWSESDNCLLSNTTSECDEGCYPLGISLADAEAQEREADRVMGFSDTGRFVGGEIEMLMVDAQQGGTK